MKISQRVLLVLITSASIFACNKGNFPHNSRNGKLPNRDLSVVENKDNFLTLDNYLKQFAGVNVTGQGANATVTIRGISSVNLSSEPLFIVDGVPISSYNAAYNSINPVEIKNVQVLKNPADTGIYGVRGANGIIIITRKQANL